MKILQLLSHGSVGGTETFVISLVKGLTDRGHDVTLVNTWTDSPVNAAARNAGVPVVAMPCGTYRIGPRWFWNVGRYLRQHRFDLVHTYGLRVSLALRCMQRRVGVKHHLLGVRGLDQQRTGIQARLDRRTEHLLDTIVCNAQAVADKRTAVVGTPASRIHIIPNGIDPAVFTTEGDIPSRTSLNLPESFLFAVVASFRPEKDHPSLFEAVRQTGDALKDAKFALIGTGKLREQVKMEAHRLGVADRFIFTGAVSDVRPYLRSCDAFVLPSYSEGMPRAMMEAMAVGKPVVATTAGGIPEIAQDEKHALLVPTRNPNELANALIRIATNQPLRTSLGTAAAQHIREHFSYDTMIDRHVTLYESILRQ